MLTEQQPEELKRQSKARTHTVFNGNYQFMEIITLDAIYGNISYIWKYNLWQSMSNWREECVKLLYVAALNIILQKNCVFHDFKERKVIHNGHKLIYDHILVHP